MPRLRIRKPGIPRSRTSASATYPGSGPRTRPPPAPSSPSPGSGLGEGWIQTEEERRLAKVQPAYWFEDLIASAPLSAWAKYGFEPADLLRATTENRWEADASHRGWRSATLRQRHPEWAEAFCAV